MKKINLGSGNENLEGYKNIDRSLTSLAEEHYDINGGIKEEDNSIDEIFAGCVLEQVDDFLITINECWRVLRPKGILRGYVPSTDPRVLYLDPMDKRFFQVETFNYLVKGHHLYETFGKNYGFEPWSETKVLTKDNGIIHFTLTK